MTAAPAPYPPAYRDTRPQLDRLMAQMRAHDPAPWGWSPVVLPCIALAVLIVAGSVFGHLAHPHAFVLGMVLTIVANTVLYGLIVAVLLRAGRGLTRRYAGWGWTFGLQRPKAIDWAWVAAGIGMVFLGRIVVVAVADAVTHGHAGTEAQNLVLHSRSVPVYVVLGVVTVLVAPLVEETMFRGLLLRNLMWHWGFWPAALVSSAIFAAFHLYEVSTIAGACTLGAVVFCLGLTNCLLARWSGRLAPGIVVHATFNALAVVALAVTNL